MITFPNAKINLGLNVVERRPDGYHNIETVFYPIGLTDILEIVPAQSGETTLSTYGNPVDCPPEKNLVMKAYRMLAEQYELPPVNIYLYKRIPDGAGLGGGSSDAAHTLTMLREMFELDITDQQLAAMASRLGADCAFFVYNRPMAAMGIGDVLTPVEVDIKGRTLLLVKPPVAVSTAQAYSRVEPATPSQWARDVVTWPIQQWDGALANDFEPSVFALFPRLWLIKAALLDGGAHYAAMSGSGSTIYGIFDDAKVAEQVSAKFADCATFVLPI